MTDKEIVIIGGGPAGYVAALRAAQMGSQATLIEEDNLGGVCLNRGCMPTKFLLHGTELYRSLSDAGQYGISAGEVNIDPLKLQAGKKQLVDNLVSGVRGLLGAAGVEIISGRAKIASGKQVLIDTGETFQAQKIIIATGAGPAGLPVPGADASDILDYKDLLNLEKIPASLVMIGGGVVGVEMATVLARLGCRITIVEMMPHILPAQDIESALVLEQALREDGITIHCGARVESIENSAAGKSVVFSVNGESNRLEAESVAITTGQRPNIAGLGLEECGIATEKGRIMVDEGLRTNVPDIFAAGDVTGGIMLAHVAFAEGRTAAENAAGGDAGMDYQAVPQCIYTSPELASVGLTEEQAGEQGEELAIGRFPFRASGMAAVLGETRGMVKIITEKQYGRILGVHIVGPNAATLIAEAALAIRMELTPQEIVETIHAHPTLSEAIWEAALDVTGETLHFPSSRHK